MTSTIEVLHVYLPHEDLAARARRTGWRGGAGALEVVDPCFQYDPVLEPLCLQLAATLSAPRRADKLFAESLASAVATRVLQRWSNLSAFNFRTRGGGLAGWQSRRVLEYLESRLGADPSLAELADLIGLSPNHFCTAFRISLGEPPHRYLVRRRLERARELLADPRLSVTEVALAVGFGSSAHFATAFRKQVGATPSAYRRERLS